MAVYTRCLVHLDADLPAGVMNVLFDCPAGRTAILKDFVLQNAGQTTRRYSLWVRRGSAFAQLFEVLELASEKSVASQARHVVLHPGDALTLFQFGSGSSFVRMGAWGSLLMGAPA